MLASAAVMLTVPGGVAQVSAPLQKVVGDAPVPLFRFPTGRLPVTSEPSLTVRVLLAPLIVLLIRTWTAAS